MEGNGMKLSQRFNLMMAIVLAIAFLSGCSTTQTEPAAPQAAAESDWMFHDIVDAGFVKEQIVVIPRAYTLGQKP